ncbi:MAG TPA: divergent polysaccharide deacetylase family protein [Candidatus Acidoferrum sp.]|nr:divergent polysaccharide deacetylase family protein [Candidatus Acidoferrum sp.]
MPLTALLDSTKAIESQAKRLRSFAPLAILVFASALILCACRNPERPSRVNAAAIHDATREFAAAARKSTPAGTAIRMKIQSAPNSQNLPDSVEITLFSDPAGPDRKTKTAQLLQALNAVAQKRGLETGNRDDEADSSSVSFRSASRITHAIKMRFLPAVESAHRTNLNADAPRLAIILDDFGSDRAAAESVFGLRYPLTLSVLPNHEHSKEIADEALRRGYQVMLHLPMQSVANESPEKEELHPGMSARQVEAMLGEMMETVPDAVGVNNHQGSQATSDPALMDGLMPALRNWNLFYVDSRTTAATVAFDAARREGIPTAFRNVPFLDDVQEVAAIRRQLDLAIRGAKEKKAAVAIGHPHPATLEALREFLPKVDSSGVRLVFVSELVH